MAKNKKKGEKISLGEFLGPEYGRSLPSAPSARDPNSDNSPYDRRPGFGEPPAGGGDTWRRPGGDRGDRGDRGGGDRFERGADRGDRGSNRFDADNTPSRADEDGEWRKSRPQSAGPGGRGAGFDAPRSVADDASEWRRKPSDRPERPTPPPSAADDATEWRRKEPMRGLDSVAPPPRSVADDASEWRRKEPLKPEGPLSDDLDARRTPKPVSIADEASEWRRKEPLKAAPEPPISVAADNDNNWRKSRPTSTEPESATTPKPSETDDWRSTKSQQVNVSESREKRGPAEADSVDDWRAASKTKKLSNNNFSAKRKRETLSVDSEVLTPFGYGVLIEERASDNVRVVKLEFGGTAYLRTEDVIPKMSEDVMTPYGKGKFSAYRFLDSMCEIDLQFGAKAFLRIEEVTSHGNKGASRSGGRPSSNKKSVPTVNSNGGPQRGRRYGDQDRDRERESAFAGMPRRGRDTQEEGGAESGAGGGRKSSEAFAAFSTSKKGTTPPPMAEDRSQAFSAFGGGNRERTPRDNAGESSYRMSRDEKEKAFAPFSQGGPKREGSGPSIGGPPRAMSQGVPQVGSATPPPPSTNSAGFSAFDRSRDRTSFPGFGGSRDRGDDQQRPPTGGASFPGFGGERRDRFSAAQSGVRGGMPPRVEIDSTSQQPPVVLRATPEPVDIASRTLPKGSKWGEDDDDVPVQQQKGGKQGTTAVATATAPVKKVTVEIALNLLPKIIKDYMIGEDRSTAIAAMSKISTEDDNEFLSTFVANLSNQSFAGTKQKKLVAGLLADMSKSGALANDVIAEGLTRTLESNVTDADKVAALKDVFTIVQEKTPSIAEVQLRGEGAKLRGDAKGSKETVQDLDGLAGEIVNAGTAGEEKLKSSGFATKAGASAALLKAVLKTAKIDEPSCSWVDKNAKTLATVLFTASEKDQKAALDAIQAAFNAAGFPKSAGGAIIDKVFTKMYNSDILPDTAFMAWKEDLSSSTPGRNTAIIQTTNFFAALEEDQYEEEEDEE